MGTPEEIAVTILTGPTDAQQCIDAADDCSSMQCVNPAIGNDEAEKLFRDGR